MRALSESRTETKTVPVFGTWRPAPSWLLAKATPKQRSRPITSPVERISGPEQHVDAREAGEREHRFLHAICGRSFGVRPNVARLSPAMIRAAILAIGLADHLGDERHRARGAGIDLQHVDRRRP